MTSFDMREFARRRDAVWAEAERAFTARAVTSRTADPSPPQVSALLELVRAERAAWKRLYSGRP